MIETGFVSKVKIQDVISNQLPNFIRDESDKTVDFLKQYYISQEYQGGPVDIVDNLENYLNVNNLVPEVIVDSSTTVGLTTIGAETINVTSTKGFPNEYGLLKIGNEIITYTGITTNSFIGCERGFSGITSYHSEMSEEDLVFSSSSASEHENLSTVQNLSSLFLKEFYKKFKKTFLPGLEETDFQPKLDVGTFISEARSLYETKGTEESFRILFNILYGITPKILNLEEKLIKPSFSKYVRRRVCIAKLLSGNPKKLEGQSLLKGLTGQTLFRTDLDSSKSASISEIEPFERNSGITGITTYFKIGLFVGYDENSDIENDFVVVPTTKVLSGVSTTDTIISVDSTVGFGTTGTIISGINTIQYTDKTVNQFLNCTGIDVDINPLEDIRSDITYFGFEDGDINKKVTLRLTGVLADFEQIEKVDVEEGDFISILGLGEKVENDNSSYKEKFCNSWVYNTSSSYFVDSLSESEYFLRSTVDDSSLKKGDFVEIVMRDTNNVIVPNSNPIHGSINIDPPFVESVTSNSVTLSGIQASLEYLTVPSEINNNQPPLGSASQIQNLKLRKIINKASSTGAPLEYGNNKIISDVQNVYIEKSSENAYVTSNSLPSFINNTSSERSKEIDINIKTISVDISNVDSLSGNTDDQQDFNTIIFPEDVPFISGDKVFYSYSNGSGLVGIKTGSYYVDVIDSTKKKIKLYTAPTNIDGGQSLTFSRNTDNGIIKFDLYSQKSSIISPQKLVKKFPLSQNISNGNEELTPTGQTGMLVNGVEITNYKSTDNIFFGPLTKFDILDGGQDYDVINLPEISIDAGIGTTALVQPVISGKVKEIYADPQNFDISEVISAEVVGGNGSGCVLEPILGERFRVNLFDTRIRPNGGGINTTSHLIVFPEPHNFTAGDEIIYDSFNNTGIGTGVASTLINKSIYYPSIVNSNSIKLHKTRENAVAGVGTITFNGKNVSGEHAFKLGLVNTLVDVRVVEEGEGYTNRKLRVNSNVGINTILDLVTFEDHGFNNGEFIIYSSDGTPITGLTTSTGITTTSNYYQIIKVDDNSFRVANAGIGGTITEDYERGKFVEFSTKGTGYQIFSYPEITANFLFKVGIGNTTINYSITPKVRGSIIQGYLYEKGTGYGSNVLNNHKKPTVTLKNGKFASIRPIIDNGQVTALNIENYGKEYFSEPNIEIIDPTGSGVGAKFRPIIEFDSIRNTSVLKSVVIVNPGIGYSTDSKIKVEPAGKDVIFDTEVRSLKVNKFLKYGLTNPSDSNSLPKIKNDEYQIIEDFNNNLKYSFVGYSTSLFGKSDLIGWAYDGNPIYGPFGSSDPQQFSNLNTRLKSGYKSSLSNIEDRPSGRPEGFFIEDYKFDNSGDLDEHNGRFEKTKEFPEGVYAYHATLGDLEIPSFPYFIGNSYRSKLIDDNFTNIDQSTFNFNTDDILRNTLPYKVADKFASNDFIVETGDIRDQQVEIEDISSGSVTGFDIVNGGLNYKVNEFLNFNNTGTSGDGLISIVSRIDGKSVEKIETTIDRNDSTIIDWSENNVNFFTSDNHNLNTNDLVTISGLSSDLSSLNNSFKINVDRFTTTTISTIFSASPGITTEIFVSNIPNSVSIGNSITIGLETLRIQDIYRSINVLTVKRLSNTALHAKGSEVKYLTNKFSISKQISEFESKKNKQLYFNAEQSVGLGNADGTEITKTFFFAGKNITRNIPIRQIYIENHNLKTNQKIKLTKPANTDILVSKDNNVNDFPIPEILFVVNKSANTIGIKTEINADELHFKALTNGNNDNFLIETQFDQIACTAEKIETKVTTITEHDLKTGDNISLLVQPSLSVGIGTSTDVRVVRDNLTGNVLINQLGFTSTGVNTTTNTINIQNHELKTGDKIKYQSNVLPEGLSNKNYFIYRVDDDNIKLCDTLIDSKQNIPNIIGIGSTGGNLQSISLINPKIETIKNNNLVFNLSDTSLSGYDFKLYYDSQFKNEFTSDGKSSVFSISTTASTPVGSAGAALTVGFSTNLPNSLYYNLEKSGVIGTVDTSVKNNSQILFESSSYNNNYSVERVIIDVSNAGISKTFTVNLNKTPEKLSYLPAECDILKYDTNSKTTSGSINSITILSGGLNYKKLPEFIGIGGSSVGVGAVIKPISDSIGNVEKVRVINEGYEYSSDKTLQPESLIASSVNIINTDSLGIVSVTNGGTGYLSTPNVIIINTNTGVQIDSGFLEPVLLENSIESVNIVETPIGLPANPVTLRTTNNTNGIVIEEVISNNSGIFTCRLSTPNPSFLSNPFSAGDRVFIEGIQKVGAAGSGFNSSDYGFNLLKVKDFTPVFNAKAEVIIDVREFTTDTGIAESTLTTFATVINESDYPKFEVIQNQASFILNELITVNGAETDLRITNINLSNLKVFGNDKLKSGDIIKGVISGSQCEVKNVTKNNARFKTDFSVLKNLGWDDSIGKLNEDFQVLPDNDYNQNMSYSIQSPIEWDSIKTVVNNLVHISGMKNFADVGIGSDALSGVSTSLDDTEVSVIVDVLGNQRVDEIKGLDTVRDVDIVGDSSRFVQFDNIRLTDFINCKTNDVLIIDDLSGQFSNIESSVNDFVELLEFPTLPNTQLINNITVVTTSNPSGKLEITDLMAISNGSENILVKKSNLINSKEGLFNTSEDNLIDFNLHKQDLTNRSTLRFRPIINPVPGNELDYDIKIFKTEFNTLLNGIGTTSIGPIDLNSKIQDCSVGITTEIISVPVSDFDSLYSTIFVFNQSTKEMNVIESYVSHKDGDTFLTESYFNGEKNSISLNKLGIITSNISSNNLVLSFENTQSNNLKLKSKTVGIGTTGKANGIYRFKSLNQLDGSERFSIYTGITSSNVGVSTIETLDANQFNAVKSVVEVSIGSSKAVSEVLFLHDGIDAYSQRSGSLSLTKDNNTEYDPSSGLGTFGASLSGSNFKLEFYPDNVSGVSTVVSLNHCFYTLVDADNIAIDLDYGVMSESNSVQFYNSPFGNRLSRTRFTPKVNNIPLYGKVFDPADTRLLDPSTGKFTIDNHFFRNNEELIYEPKSTFIGIGSTPMQFKGASGGIGSLTSPVFAIVNDENSFSISTTKSGTAVTFTSLGEGNAHQFSMAKANEKSLFIVDDVVQYPLIRTDVEYTLNSNLSGEVGVATDIIHLSGITTISSTDILKIENEFVEVINVGFATTGGAPVGTSGTFNTVQVNRGFVGSSATTHLDGVSVQRFKGSYHINGKDLHFTKPPRGDLTGQKTINDLNPPTSQFSGRVYLRENYETNQIFDDISDQFTGIKSDFILKVGGANTVGLGSTGGNGVLFINGIFQSPSTQFNPNKNFRIVETGSGASGVSTVIFTGITSSNGNVIISNNINTNELPRGGVPIAIGNTVNGLGYAPLVGAEVKPLTNASGQITSIVGTAYSSSDLGVVSADYSNTTGIMTITTVDEHPFNGSGDFVLLDNMVFNPAFPSGFIRKNEIEVVSIAATNIFTVSIGKSSVENVYTSGGDVYPYYPSLTFGSGYNDIVSIGVTVYDYGYEHRFITANPNAITVVSGGTGSRTPTDVLYNPVNGTLTITCNNHGLDSSVISIADNSLFFSCSKDAFKTTHSYPRATDPASTSNSQLNNGQLSVTKISEDIFSVNVGTNVGSGADISAVAGVGGTAIFTINNSGSGYKTPYVFVSEPSYSNLSIKGVSRLGVGLTTDTGTDLRVTAITKPATGIGSTLFEISEYEVVNSGFAFKKGDVVEPVGLVTSGKLSQLQERSTLTIEKVYNDNFALWQFGKFEYIDSIEDLQDGSRTSFPIKLNNQLVSVEIDNDTIDKNVNIENMFIVTVNGVIQDPIKSYSIIGGNVISFTEAPLGNSAAGKKDGDDISILFYRGTAGEDSVINLAQKIIIEQGDNIQIKRGLNVPEQDERTVSNLETSQKLETNPYIGVGISSEESRPLNLIKQKEDKIINKVLISKKRSSIEPRITPVARVISDVTTSNTTFFVDSTDLFNYEGESTPLVNFELLNSDFDNKVKASASAIVSVAGTISGFNFSNFGSGYTVAPTVKIASPPVTVQSGLGTIDAGNPLVGVGTTATATATIGAGGTITQISVNNPGLGYSQTNPPQVLISSPNKLPDISERLSTKDTPTSVISENTGVITGIGTTLFSGKLGIKFNLKSYHNDPFSIINVGNPIYVFDTRSGNGIISIDKTGTDSNIIGIGTTFSDNIYEIVSVTTDAGTKSGIITAHIKSDTVVTNIDLSGSEAQPVGKYSVGSITNLVRGSNPISIGVTGLTVGLTTAVGISTFPILKRTGGDKTFEQTGALIPE